MHAFLADHPFVVKHQAKIQAVLCSFDRMIFRGYLPICHPRGLAGWMQQRGVPYRQFKHFAPQLAERLVQHAKSMAARAGRLYEHHARREAKEEMARAIAQRDGIQEGLVCVFSCLETCRTFRLRYGPGRPLLQPDLRRCTVLYFFFMDRECGLIHIKLHTWLPLTCQVYVNGHSWLERQLQKHALGYTAVDNAFLKLADPKAVQRLADRFVKVNWRKRLDTWARQVNPLLGEELRGPKGIFSYWWVTDQAEYSTDVLFASRADLQALQAALVSHASLCFSSVDVLRFFGRKPEPRLALDVRTEKKPYAPDKENPNPAAASFGRVDGVRVRHQVGSNKLKMYDKEGLVLRIETVINDPTQFRVRRRLAKPGWAARGEPAAPSKHGRGSFAWQPLRKSVVWLWKYAEVSFASNRRYLEALAIVDDPSAAHRLLDRVTRPQTLGKRRRRALQPLSPQDQALFRAVLCGEHHLHGLRNRDVAEQLFGPAPPCAAERRRRGAHVTRLIQLLRAHGLLAKVPRARRYRVTAAGQAFMSAALYIRHKYLPRELTAA